MDIRWFHGLAAYNKGSNDSKYCPIETMRRAGVVAGGAELACSDKAIGAFGLVVEGQTRVVFERDCWSAIDQKRGTRYTAHAWADYLANWVPDGMESDEQSAHEWCAKQAHAYCEAFVSKCTILAVWCKEDASDARYWQAKSLALKLRVPFLEIAKNATIGQWCGTVDTVLNEEFA